MTDPLSVSASVVGLIGGALQATKFLLDELQRIIDAPKTIRRLVGDVQSVDAAVKLLGSVGSNEWDLLGEDIAEQSKATINSCAQACDLFRTGLQRWTKNSEDGKLTWKDRTKVGIFKQGQIKAMSEQLQNCKLTIITTVGVAALYSSVRHSHITNEIREAISAKHIEVKDAITTADKQMILLEDRLEELNFSSDDEEETRSVEDRTDTLRQFNEERRALNTSKKLLDDLLSKASEEAIVRAATGNQSGFNTITFGNNNSGFQAGVINGTVSGISFGVK